MANFKHTARRDTQQNNTAGTRNTTGSTVQSQAQSQAQPQTKSATRQTSNNSQGVSYKHSAPSSQASRSASQPTQQKQQKSSQRSVQQTQTQQKAQRQYGQRSNVKTSAPTIQATVQNAPTVQQSASQQTRNPNTAQGRRNIEANKTTGQKAQERTRWDTIKTIVESAARNNKITAPFMQVADAVERKSTPEARYSAKTNTGNKEDENKSLTRKVVEKASDIIRSIPEAIANNRENRSIQFGLSDAEQERIARERGASDEDIALAKQAFAENINYINRNAQHGHTYEKMVENQMRTAGGLPMDSWLRFLPDDDGNIIDRSLNSARAGVLMHGQGLTGLQANIGNRLGANNYAQDRLDDYRYQQLLTQQALSGDNQGAYDRIFANSVSNLLTGLETTALGQLGGMSLGTHALENVGLGNMSLNAFGNAYGNVMTGGMGEQYAGDVDAARRYAYASALNELGQEKMFDVLGLVSGGKITENTIPGANVFGLGSFITEAAEEGTGALVDPFTEAALEGNIFSPEYWKRVGEIYGEQGLAGTMQNVRDSAIEGGLGGVMGGVMSNPYQSVRQVGTDINAVRADLGSEGVRNALKEYDRAVNAGGEGVATPTPNDYGIQTANAVATDVDQETLDRYRRQKMQDNIASDFDDVYDENFAAYEKAQEDSKWYNEKYGNSSSLPNMYDRKADKAITNLKQQVAKGGLRSSIPSVRERAQRANELIIRHDASVLDVRDADGKRLNPKILDNIIKESNNIGIPVDFLPWQTVIQNGAGAWYAPGPGGKRTLQTGVIHLPNRPILEGQTMYEAFEHEITHVGEGSPEYYRYIEDLMDNDTATIDAEGNVRDYDGAENTPHPDDRTYAGDRWNRRGVETFAHRSADFSVNTSGGDSYANDRNEWSLWNRIVGKDPQGNSSNTYTRKKIGDTTEKNLETRRAAKWIKNNQTLHYDALGRDLLDLRLRETLKRDKNAKYVDGYNNVTIAEAREILNQSNATVPADGSSEFDVMTNDEYFDRLKNVADVDVDKTDPDLYATNEFKLYQNGTSVYDIATNRVRPRFASVTNNEKQKARELQMAKEDFENQIDKILGRLPGDDNVIPAAETSRIATELIMSEGKQAVLPDNIKHLEKAFFEGTEGRPAVAPLLYNFYKEQADKIEKRYGAEKKTTKAKTSKKKTLTEEERLEKKLGKSEVDTGTGFEEVSADERANVNTAERELKSAEKGNKKYWDIHADNSKETDAILASIFGDKHDAATFTGMLKSRFKLTQDEAKTVANVMMEKGFSPDVLNELVNEKGIKALATVEQGGDLLFNPHKELGNTYNEYAPRKLGFKPYTTEQMEAYDEQLAKERAKRGSKTEFEEKLSDKDKKLLDTLNANARKYATKDVDESNATIDKQAEGKKFVIDPDGTFAGTTVNNLYQGLIDQLRDVLVGRNTKLGRAMGAIYGTHANSYQDVVRYSEAKAAFDEAKNLYRVVQDLKQNGVNSEYFKNSGYTLADEDTIESLGLKGKSQEEIAQMVDDNLTSLIDISDDKSLTSEQKLEKSLALFKDKQAVEEKTEPVRKTEQDVFEEVVNKETPKKKQRKPKVEQKTVETEKTEEKKEEERKEETPKEEISEQELPAESEEPEIITRAKTAYGNGDVKSLSNYYKELGISEETADKLAQRIRDGGNSANLEQTAARELTQANKEEYPEVADARDAIGNINSALRDVKVTETESKKEEAPAKRGINEPSTISKERQRDLDTLAFFRDQNEENAGLPSDMERVHRKADSETERPDRLRQKNRIAKSDTEVASMNAHEMMQYFHDEDWGYVSEEAEKEIEDLAKETENNKVVSREEGDVYNSVAALLYRAGGKLETVNEFAKHLEETGKEGKVKQAGRRQVERELLENGEFKTIEGAGQFVDKVVNAYKKMSNTKSDESVEMTGADFNRMTAEPASGEGYEQNADMKDTLESTTISKRRVRKRDRIYEQVEENVKKVNDTAKKVKGEEFNKKDTETIKTAETRAEEKKEEKHERQQVKLEDFVAKQAEKMRQASSDRLNYAQDFSKSQTTAKFVKDKYWDEGLRARAEESHLIKAVKHDADVKADAVKWNDESGQGGVVAYAEAMNRDNGYDASEEELLYLIEGFKRANKLQKDITQNITHLENDKSEGAKEALSKMRDEQKYQMDACVTLFEAIKGDGSEAGRALRAMRFLYETPELIPVYMQRKIAQLNKKYAKQLKNREIKLNQELLDKISNPDISDEERDDLWDKINYDIADQLPRTISGRITQWRKTGMLLNPRTHVRNMVSNGLTYYVLFGLNDKVQAGVENAVLKSKLLQKVMNTEYTTADRRAAARVDKSYMEVAEWLDKQHKYSREAKGSGKFNLFEGISEAGAFSNKNAFGRAMNRVARWNNKQLEKEDRYFVEKRAHKAMAEMLQSQGYTVKKTDSGFEIIGKDKKAIKPNVLEAIEREALKNAQEATYHDLNKAAKALENLKKSLGPAGTAIDIIVPFTKTPANIMRRSFEFSPLGLMRAVSTDLYKVRQGDMSASTYVTRLSRGLTGTMMFVIGALFANMGLLSSPGDDDEDGRTSYYEENVFGRQNLALHVGDRYYSLDWAMPTSAPLMMGAAMSGEFAKHGLNILDYDPKEVLSDAASAINPVLEASYLGSLSDFMTSYAQGINYGGNVMPKGTLGGFERAGTSIVENFAGQMVPTVGGAINRTLNSTKRTTSGNTMGERIKNKVLSGTYSWGLEPAIDEKGQEMENVGALFGNNFAGRAVYNFLTPMTITEDTHDKLDSALMDVGAVALPRNQTGTGGLKGQILSDLSRAGMNLSDISGKEYTEVKKTYYGNYREYAKAYNELAEYNNLGTHARDDVYKKLEQLALAEAKATYYDKVGSTDDLYSEEQKAALELKKLGVSPAQFYLMKDCGLTGNRRALYIMSELETLGVADDVERAILSQKCFPSAFGLTDSILVKTPDEREAAREKYLVEDEYESLESKVAAYRALSNEEYEKKKKQDSEENVQDSWESLFSKYDKKYGTNYSAAFANLNNKEGGKGTSGKGRKGKGSSGGRRKSSTKTTREKTTSTKNSSRRRGRRSGGGGGGSSVDADTLALFERFMKYANGALKSSSKSNSGIKASVSTSSEAALFDSIVNSSKSDVEKLKRELGLK